MPVYRKKGRGPSTWTVAISHRGRRTFFLVRGNKSDAEAFEARKRVELEAGDPAVMRTAPTFSAFCKDRYKPHAQMRLKARTWKNRTYQIATLVKHVGDLRLTDITSMVVEGFMQKRRLAGIGVATVNDEVKVLARILSFAREQGTPCATPKVTLLKTRKSQAVKAWTPEQIAKLLEQTGKLVPDILPLVVFLANTGCRKGEAIALKWEHVDLEQRVVRIESTDEWSPKSDRWRDVPISDALLPWLKKRGEGPWVFPRPRAPGNANPKEPKVQTEPWAYWPQKWFDQARKAAKLEGGPHKLRHSYATAFLATTPDLFLLGRVLGHSHGRVTELYSHVMPDHLARARTAVSIAAPVTAAEHAAETRWKTVSKRVSKASGAT